VAYVDTELGPVPPAVGQIQGTPTIKAFVPKRSSARNDKTVVEYDQAREVSELMRFAVGRMPNYVEAIGGSAELSTFDAKAREWGLPRVLVFSTKSGATASTLKALSAEFRRRVLIGEVRAQRKELAPVVARYHVTAFPTLLCLPAGGGEDSSHRFENKEPSYHRLSSFVGKCALRKPVRKKPSVEADAHAEAAAGKEEL